MGPKLTILSALEIIRNILENSGLFDEDFEKCKRCARYLKKQLSLEGSIKEVTIQTFAISEMLETGMMMSSVELAQKAGVSNIQMMTYMPIIELLRTESGLLRRAFTRRQGESVYGYSLTKDFRSALMRNEPYVGRGLKDYTSQEVMKRILNLLVICDRDSEYFSQMICDINSLLESTRHTHLSASLIELKKELRDDEIVMFLIAASTLTMKNDDSITPPQYTDIMMESDFAAEIYRGINEGTGRLATLRLMENDTTDGSANRDVFRVTEHACETILKDFDCKLSEKPVSCPDRDLIKPETIAAKTLFYNEREAEQVRRLTDILQPGNYENLSARLKESGLRTGCCVLLHGAPGTGKTETVLQLARNSNHPIYMVDMSSVKSKWVGESEKNVQSIFDRYNRMVQDAQKRSEPIPLLLLNEADALLGKRMQNEDMSSVDKMQNTMQNIILQNMESLEGVMIATTNLTKNLDQAMARRWLITIAFDTPGLEAKAKIFRSMIPELTASQSKALAEEFPTFAGGQMENVCRRQKIDHILYGTPFSFDHVRKLCREEGIQSTSSRKPVGFCC